MFLREFAYTLSLASACLLVLNGCSGGALSSSAVPGSAVSTSSIPSTAAGTPLASPGALLLTSTIQKAGVDTPVARMAKSAASSTSALLFYDDFEDSSTVNWTPVAGSWPVCQRAQTGHEYCASPKGEHDTFAGSSSWTDYSVSAFINMDSFVQARNGIDLVARVQDVNHFYEVELVNENGGQQWELWKKDGSATWSNLAHGYITFAAGNNYLVKLDVNGSRLTVSLSRDRGVSFAELGIANDSRYSSGKIGLRAWGGMTGSFDDVSVVSDVPATSVGALNVVNYDGCNIFPADDKVYNTDYYGTGIDENSAAMIASQTNVDASAFDRETYFGDEKVNLDEHDAGPKYTPTGHASYHPSGANNDAKWPWASGNFIEPGPGDTHAFVLDSYGKPNHCYIYESYQTAFTGSGGPLSWSSGVFWDLGQYYQPPSRMGYGAPGWGSVNAIGNSMFAAGVKLDEAVAGPIKHALNVAVVAHSLAPGPNTAAVRYPAEIGESYNYVGTGISHEMPYGAHLRLKASFSVGACSTVGSQAYNIIYALKHYGGYVSDTGADGNGVYMWGTNGNNAWDQSGILNCLRNVHMTDFDVLPAPPSNPAIPIPNPNPTAN